MWCAPAFQGVLKWALHSGQVAAPGIPRSSSEDHSNLDVGKEYQISNCSSCSMRAEELAKPLQVLPARRRHLFSGCAKIFSEGDRVSSTLSTPSHWATAVFTHISVKCPSTVQLSECQELFQSSLGRIPTSPICVCTWWLSAMLKSNQESAWSTESSLANPPHCI